MTPKNYPQNLHTQKNIHFSEKPKTYGNFDPPHPPPPPPPKKKNSPSLRMYENIRVPPPPPLGFECLTLLKIEVIEYTLQNLCTRTAQSSRGGHSRRVEK